MKKISMIALMLAHIVTCMQAQQTNLLPNNPKYEMRAVWLTTIKGLDWPQTYATTPATVQEQKRQFVNTLDRLKRAGINTILFQTRVRATTLYPSSIEPWDECLSGNPRKSPCFDPLQFAIDECHRRGMQLHAWVVTIPIGKWTSAGCSQLRQHHPNLVRKIGQDGFMDPENPKTADYIADICEEIVRRYDVDGIHLDYIRYPETWKIKVSRTQGRSNITRIASVISRRVKAVKPWVMMSCSPIGKHDDLSRYSSKGWNARTAVCQDAQAWLRDGIMDALFPMMYFRGDNFYPFAIDWAEHTYGRIVAPGLATYMLDSREGNWPLVTVTQELEVLRQLGLGHAHFRSRFLTENTKGILHFSDRFDQTPALVPPMTWLRSTPPAAPVRFTVTSRGPAISLTWQPAHNQEIQLYNVYGSRSYPVDTDDPNNLIAMRLASTSINIPPKYGHLYFAVTTLDRYGNESRPIQQDKTQKPNSRERILRIGDRKQGSKSYIRLPDPAPQDVKGVTEL